MELYNELIKAYPKGEIDFVEWAKGMTAETPRDSATEIENWRSKLLLAVKATTEVWKDEAGKEVETDTVFHMLITLIQLDRANALYKMKIARSDPDCPSGFMWCTDKDLVHMTIGGVTARSSITSHYVRFAKLHNFSEEQMAQVELLLQPTMPTWMSEKLKEQKLPRIEHV